MQHDAPFVVVLVTEPTGDAFDLLDDAVVPLGPGVRNAQFQEAFAQINENFSRIFTKLFNGGQTWPTVVPFRWDPSFDPSGKRIALD